MPDFDRAQVALVANKIWQKTGCRTEESFKDMWNMSLAAKDIGEISLMRFIDHRLQKVYRSEFNGNEDLLPIYWKSMRNDAPYDFEKFMICMERNRPENEQFYLPRINPLHQVAQGIQDLADDKLDELFINLPSRTGKTQIVKFAMVWFGSRNPELSNLYTAYSDKITLAFYTGLTELMTDPTYTYAEIFPQNKIVKTKGDDEIIDLNRVKTYPTFTCRSIYGTLNGACDCNGLGVSDDLLSGIEEALSPDRLETVWGKYDNNFMQRLKMKSKLINMGTRWAILDPQGRRRTLLENDPAFANRRYRIISIPALDENDESNFDYPFAVGYSSEYYKQRRASFEANNDMASWLAQAQQEPIDRQGAMFTPETMKFYNGELPLDEDGKTAKPDRVFMACDEAFGGGDFVSAPICYQYGNQYFIHDVVFDDGDKFVTRPLVAEAILNHSVSAAQFEETKTTADYHEWVDDYLRERNYRCNITTKAPSTRTSKQMRIFDKAPEIREFYFRDTTCRSPMYNKFMMNLYAFKMEGKVKHDDAPDSMAQLCEMKNAYVGGTRVINSPF
jgi:hypothetical protein